MTGTHWISIGALAIAIITLIAGQLAMRRVDNRATVANLEKRIEKLEQDLEACENARQELIRVNQDLMKRLIENGGERPPGPS